MSMYYFAYGSNLSSKFIRDYTPSAKFTMKADLPNYKVEFRHFSKDLGGGISSIVEAPGSLVKGVIYDVPELELEELDILESVPEGTYRRDTYIVMGEDGQWHHADLYRVSTPSGPYTPSTRYVDFMVEGAREHGLDAEYIEQLLAIRKTLD
jgi:gamma-glutamylcyclotransferase